MNEAPQSGLLATRHLDTFARAWPGLLASGARQFAFVKRGWDPLLAPHRLPWLHLSLGELSREELAVREPGVSSWCAGTVVRGSDGSLTFTLSRRSTLRGVTMLGAGLRRFARAARANGELARLGRLPGFEALERPRAFRRLCDAAADEGLLDALHRLLTAVDEGGAVRAGDCQHVRTQVLTRLRVERDPDEIRALQALLEELGAIAQSDRGRPTA